MLATFLLALPLLVPQTKDSAAVDAYRRGDFETAQGLWIASLEESGRVSAAERGRILYDVGNAAYRRGNVLEAVGWYTASLRLRPRDPDAWKNLEHARANAHLQPADRGDLSSTWRRIVFSLTREESEWLALAGALVLGVVLAAEAVRGGRLFRRLSLVGFLLALASLAPWVYHCSREGEDSVLVVDAAEAGAEVHSEPRADATVIGHATAGDEAERLDELPEWVKIETSDGTSGWIEARAAFPLKR